MSDDSKIIAMMIAVLAFFCAIYILAVEYEEDECVRRGGEYVTVYKGHICLKPGSVIK